MSWMLANVHYTHERLTGVHAGCKVPVFSLRKGPVVHVLVFGLTSVCEWLLSFGADTVKHPLALDVGADTAALYPFFVLLKIQYQIDQAGFDFCITSQ